MGKLFKAKMIVELMRLIIWQDVITIKAENSS